MALILKNKKLKFNKKALEKEEEFLFVINIHRSLLHIVIIALILGSIYKNGNELIINIVICAPLLLITCIQILRFEYYFKKIIYKQKYKLWEWIVHLMQKK